jgi:hypothetical protein
MSRGLDYPLLPTLDVDADKRDRQTRAKIAAPLVLNPQLLFDDLQAELFPRKFDASRLVIACDIESEYLFSIDLVMSRINNLFLFNTRRYYQVLERCGVSEADVYDLSRCFSPRTRATLSKLMMVLGVRAGERAPIRLGGQVRHLTLPAASDAEATS